jgi:hypothetical protein
VTEITCDSGELLTVYNKGTGSSQCHDGVLERKRSERLVSDAEKVLTHYLTTTATQLVAQNF